MIARLAAASAALALLQQGGAPFRAETRLVVVEATVRNTRGELVTGLTRDAFTILENGKRQPIVLFDKDDVPVSLGLLIDNSGSMRTKRAKVEAAAIDFARASNPLDEMFVLNFADKSRVDVPFTSDVHVLEAGLARVDSIGGTAMRDALAEGEAYLLQHARHEPVAWIAVGVKPQQFISIRGGQGHHRACRAWAGAEGLPRRVGQRAQSGTFGRSRL